jgi:hypothetical protein
VYFSNAKAIAKHACKISKQYLNMECDYRELLEEIKAADIPAFRLCPISCRQYPVLYFLSPYPRKMLPFIDHAVAHEVLHLKYAFFATNQFPYFTPRKTLRVWKRAGYRAFSLEDVFGGFANKYGVEKTSGLIAEYGERFRDFFINRELLRSSIFQLVTEKWTEHELFVTAKEKMRMCLRELNTSSAYRLRLLALDIGIKLAVLQEKAAKNLQRRPTFPQSFGEEERIVKEVNKKFRHLTIICDPDALMKEIVELNEIVGLSKYMSP